MEKCKKRYKLKELCDKYNIPYDSKRAERCRKKLNRYCVFDRIGNSYFIVRERTEEEREFMVKFTNCKKLLKGLVCQDLNSVDGNTLRMNTKEFLEYFGVVNQHYKDFSYPNLTKQKVMFLEKIDMTDTMLMSFYEDVNPILNRLLKEVFKDLENEMLIKKNEIMMYGIREGYVKEDGSVNYYIRKYQATNDEIEKFLETMKDILTENGLKGIDETNYYQRKRFYDETCKKLKWDFVYNDYEIILNRKGLQQEVTKEMLNKEVCKKIMLSKQGNLKEYKKKELIECINAVVRL